VEFSGSIGPTAVIGLSSDNPGAVDLELGARAFYAMRRRLDGAAETHDGFYNAWGPAGDIMFVFLQRLYLDLELRYLRTGNETWARFDPVGQTRGEAAGHPLAGRQDVVWNFSAGYRWLF
jgi:hypothetical protein